MLTCPSISVSRTGSSSRISGALAACHHRSTAYPSARTLPAAIASASAPDPTVSRMLAAGSGSARNGVNSTAAIGG